MSCADTYRQAAGPAQQFEQSEQCALENILTTRISRSRDSRAKSPRLRNLERTQMQRQLLQWRWTDKTDVTSTTKAENARAEGRQGLFQKVCQRPPERTRKFATDTAVGREEPSAFDTRYEESKAAVTRSTEAISNWAGTRTFESQPLVSRADTSLPRGTDSN